MTEQITGRTWLYHPNGAKVELPLPYDPIDAFDYVNDCISAGFLVNPPETTGLNRLDVAYIVRAQFNDKNGNLRNRVYFYKSWGEMGSDMTVYLDSEEDVERLERASGVVFTDMLVWKAKAAPQRTSGDFERFAKATRFTITREKEEPSERYPNGRWVLIDYVGFAKSAQQTVEQPTPPPAADTMPENTTEMACSRLLILPYKGMTQFQWVAQCGTFGNVVSYTSEAYKNHFGDETIAVWKHFAQEGKGSGHTIDFSEPLILTCSEEVVKEGKNKGEKYWKLWKVREK